MVTRLNFQIVALLSILIFSPSLVSAQSENEMKEQSNFGKLDCMEGSYHGIDNQGNYACRDILTNQIVEPETQMITDSKKEIIPDSENEMIVDSRRGITSEQDVGKNILNDNQMDYGGIVLLGLIVIVAGVIGVFRKKIVYGITQRLKWSRIDKDQVRTNQYGRCNICFKKPERWTYDHIDGDKRNNDINNIQGLCSKCKSEKMMIKI